MKILFAIIGIIAVFGIIIPFSGITDDHIGQQNQASNYIKSAKNQIILHSETTIISPTTHSVSSKIFEAKPPSIEKLDFTTKEHFQLLHNAYGISPSSSTISIQSGVVH